MVASIKEVVVEHSLDQREVLSVCDDLMVTDLPSISHQAGQALVSIRRAHEITDRRSARVLADQEQLVHDVLTEVEQAIPLVQDVSEAVHDGSTEPPFGQVPDELEQTLSTCREHISYISKCLSKIWGLYNRLSSHVAYSEPMENTSKNLYRLNERRLRASRHLHILQHSIAA